MFNQSSQGSDPKRVFTDQRQASIVKTRIEYPIMIRLNIFSRKILDAFFENKKRWEKKDQY